MTREENDDDCAHRHGGPTGYACPAVPKAVRGCVALLVGSGGHPALNSVASGHHVRAGCIVECPLRSRYVSRVEYGGCPCVP